MANDNLMNQDEIEQLLNMAGTSQPQAEESAAAGPPATTATADPVAASSGSGANLPGRGNADKLTNPEGKSATSTAPAPASSPTKDNYASPLTGEVSIAQRDVEYLFTQAEKALASIESPAGDDMPQNVTAFRLEEFPGAAASTEIATFDLIRDVELDLKIELGRTHMYLEDVLKLRKGSVVPLDKLAGDPVDLYVNGRLIARGEVLVLNDNFCVRVAELIAGSSVFE
jgi:flagellar motor switch protein FliN